MKFRFPGAPAAILATNTGKSNDNDAAAEISHDTATTALHHKEAGVSADTTSDDASSGVINTEYQHGTQLVEAMTQVWTKRDLYIAYVL